MGGKKDKQRKEDQNSGEKDAGLGEKGPAERKSRWQVLEGVELHQDKASREIAVP